MDIACANILAPLKAWLSLMVAIFRNGVRAVCIKSNAMGFLAEKGVAQLISKHGPDFVFLLVLKINYIQYIYIYIYITIYI